MSTDKAAELLDQLSGASSSPDHPALKLFSQAHPLTKEFEFSFLGVKDGTLKIRGIASEKFACDTETDRVHSAFISLFFDTAMGSVVLGELEKPQPIATINMSVNHTLPAKIGEALVCIAKFEGDEEEVAYASAKMVRESDGTIIAFCHGTFMVGTRSKPMPKRA